MKSSSENIAFPDYTLFVKKLSVPNSEGKPTLVFLHDSWGCVEMWGGFPEQICTLTGMSALVYDRQGYGKSSPFAVSERSNDYLHREAQVLMDLLDVCGVDKVVLYGHSDGASIALIAGALFPERVVGLLVEGPHSFVEESGKDAVRASRERAKHSRLLENLEKFHGAKTSELFRLWHETWLRPEFVTWSIVPLLHRIQCPVLAFQGENDAFGTIKQLDILRSEIPTEVVAVEIEHAAHTPRKEAEEETMRWIEKYFRDSLKFNGLKAE